MMKRTPGQPPADDGEGTTPVAGDRPEVAPGDTPPAGQNATTVTVAGIRDALITGDFTAYYLPIVQRSTDGRWRIVAAEALARWHQDGRPAPLLPGAFMPVAKSAGLAGNITDFILRQAAEQTRAWHSSGIAIDLTVNLDARLLTDPGVPDRLERLMQEYDVAPRHLTLEFTEAAPLAEPQLTMEIMTNLRRRGFRLSLDDFGTGYSSLTHLNRMPFDELKLDRSLMQQVPGNVQGEKILRALVQFGRTLGLTVCSEGIDREELLQFVTDLGCERLQGHLISAAMPAGRMEEFYRCWTGELLAA
ncbi:MAG: EAL domain-containing protein [Gammaproteobacteria bacterium]